MSGPSPSPFTRPDPPRPRDPNPYPPETGEAAPAGGTAADLLRDPMAEAARAAASAGLGGWS